MTAQKWVDDTATGGTARFEPLTEEELAQQAIDEAAAAVVPVPQLIEMGKAKLELLATPWPPGSPTTTLWAEVKALAAADEELAIELSRTHLSRTRDKTLQLQAYFGLSDEVVDAMFIAANARP